MQIGLLVRVLKDFRHPLWGFEWMEGFLRERITAERHRRRISEYDNHQTSMSAALAKVAGQPEADLEHLLKPELFLDYNPSQVGQGAVSWAGSSELARICFAICRITKPSVVVETGVGSGMSSWSFLAAMQENSNGHLYSVDLPTPNSSHLPSIGHLVPSGLKSRWELNLGSSARVLPKILQKVGTVDVFLHDSRHSYSNQMMEYGLVWPHLRPGGVLISDDISNDALLEMAENQRVDLMIVDQSKPCPIGILIKPAVQ